MAVPVVLAAHDRDRAYLRQLVGGVPTGSMLMVIEYLAALADEGLTVAMRNPDAAREALAGVALDLAADLGASRTPQVIGHAASGSSAAPCGRAVYACRSSLMISV